MSAVFCLSEEGEKFKKILVNHQIQKTQTIIETVQASLQDLTNVAATLANRILETFVSVGANNR